MTAKKLIQEIPYLKALEQFARVIPRNNFSSLRILTEPAEIEAWEKATGDKARVFVLSTPTSPIVIFLHPVKRADGSYGVYHQVARSEIYNGKGIVLFPLWIDNDGVKRVVMVKHQRPTLHQHFGEGWELEVPSFGQRIGKTILESIEEEVVAEGNLSLIGEPQRLDSRDSPGCPMLPGITSEMSEIWLVHVTPNLGEPREDHEGILGRVFLTKDGFKDVLCKGIVEIDGRIYLTNLFHNLVAASFAELKGVW